MLSTLFRVGNKTFVKWNQQSMMSSILIARGKNKRTFYRDILGLKAVDYACWAVHEFGTKVADNDGVYDL